MEWKKKSRMKRLKDDKKKKEKEKEWEKGGKEVFKGSYSASGLDINAEKKNKKRN